MAKDKYQIRTQAVEGSFSSLLELKDNAGLLLLSVEEEGNDAQTIVLNTLAVQELVRRLVFYVENGRVPHEADDVQVVKHSLSDEQNELVASMEGPDVDRLAMLERTLEVARRENWPQEQLDQLEDELERVEADSAPLYESFNW